MSLAEPSVFDLRTRPIGSMRQSIAAHLPVQHISCPAVAATAYAAQPPTMCHALVLQASPSRPSSPGLSQRLPSTRRLAERGGARHSATTPPRPPPTTRGGTPAALLHIRRSRCATPIAHRGCMEHRACQALLYQLQGIGLCHPSLLRDLSSATPPQRAMPWSARLRRCPHTQDGSACGAHSVRCPCVVQWDASLTAVDGAQPTR